MRFRALCLVWLGAIAMPIAAHAGRCEFSIQGGTSIPTGDFGDEEQANANAGWMVVGAVDYVFGDAWSLGVDGAYSGNVEGSVGQTIDFGGGDLYTLDKDDFSTLQVGVHGRVLIPSGSPLKPYALVGVGLSSTKEEFTETFTSGGITTTNSGTHTTGSHFSGKAGIGASWWVNGLWGLGAEADYNYVNEGADGPITYVGLRGGIAIRLAGSSAP
jgi:Outer membrane protein beta-barrel domain